jgi:transcriptional regulator with XRE-family HTH domain
MEATADVSRRQDLAAFLRARRNAVRPEDVGINDLSGRHVSGLRREEVAALAGMSTTWYTWIEQGREINVSPEALERVGRALRLTPKQVEYMNALAKPAPSVPFDLEPRIPDALSQMVLGHTAAPAYVATPRFDLHVWNEFMTDVFHYDRKDDALSRNILWRMFFDPMRRHVYVDWEYCAAMMVANFRHVYANYRENPHFEALVETLLQNDDFARMWERWDVQAPADNLPFVVRDRRRGLCELQPVQATLDAAPGCYLVVFSCKQRS